MKLVVWYSKFFSHRHMIKQSNLRLT